MIDAIKPLLESGLIDEGVSEELTEAWESKLNEARESIRAELREEFAHRYEHDKSVMVEALDRMITDNLTTEIQAVAEEKAALAGDRVKFQGQMKESATKFNDFMVSKLAEEIGELRKDRKTHNEGFKKLEKFVVENLAKEITEFAQDKRELVETKVRLVSEARGKLESLKAQFVSESADKLSKTVSTHLKNELNQLHEDIKVARENNFGRRIFEAFAAEFGSTHLNENEQVRKLTGMIAEKERQLAESIEIAKKSKDQLVGKTKEIKMIKESNERQQTLEELLSPLNAEKRTVMKDLLESVQTSRLKNAYEKYLPAVLAENSRKPTDKAVVTESRREVTGDKKLKATHEEDLHNVIDIKRLAGLN